jgi:hypothetical protein
MTLDEIEDEEASEADAERRQRRRQLEVNSKIRWTLSDNFIGYNEKLKVKFHG